MFRHASHYALVAALSLVCTAQTVLAQQAARPKLTTKVYRVDDLVLPSPNYPFRGTWLPGMTKDRAETAGDGPKSTRSRPRRGGMGGMMPGGGEAGSMMGGMGAPGGMPGMPGAAGGPGMMGGGGVSFTELEDGDSFSLTMSNLIHAIIGFIEPLSWNENNPEMEADIGRLGSALVVRQTEENQQQIGAFLEALRQENSATQTLSVEAQWLLLDSEQLAELKAGGRKLDRKALARLDEGVRQYRGQVSCFNGQTVHIVSGHLQTVLQGAVPVVGASSVAYQPTMFTPHVGAMLEITPTVLPGAKAAIINVQSSVTRWDSPGAAGELGGGEAGIGTGGGAGIGAGGGAVDEAGGSPGGPGSSRAKKPTAAPGFGAMPGMPGMSGMASMQAMGAGHPAPAMHIDRLNVAAQQLATSLRVPLNQPVLVGGMTFPSSDESQAHRNRQLYLIVEISTDSEPE